MNSELKPKIRFKGFTDDWEQRKAKELCSITTGKSNTQDQVQDGKYPFYIRSDVPVRSNRYLYDEEAVITIGDGNIGRVFHYANGKFDLHQRCYKMADFKALTAKYFYYYFSTKFYERAMSMTAKATVDSVRLEMISDMEIKFPKDTTEQTNISELLTNLDNLITLHQRKCDKLVELKKSLLEKMFPQNNSVIPEIRFKGFTNDWEQRKLGDVSFFKQGSQVDLDKQYSDLNENRVRFIRIVDYTQNTDDIRYIDKELSNNIINEKDVVIVRYGATAGFVGHGITGVLANNMFTVNPENDIAKDYLYIYLKQDKIYKKLNNSNGSSAMPALNFGTVKDVEIAYPLVAEQIEISKLFTNIDNLITLHQCKYDKLNKIRQSLLNDMFI